MGEKRVRNWENKRGTRVSKKIDDKSFIPETSDTSFQIVHFVHAIEEISIKLCLYHLRTKALIPSEAILYYFRVYKSNSQYLNWRVFV